MIHVSLVQELPLLNEVTIEKKHLDLMGHMNVREYLGIFDNTTWILFNQLGLTVNYYKETQSGSFALEQHLRYFAEVRLGETVQIHSRILARTPKRVHFMHFMVNKEKQVLAATIENLGAHIDMTVRRTSPFPTHIAQTIDAMLTQHSQLEWDAPIAGPIRP